MLKGLPGSSAQHRMISPSKAGRVCMSCTGTFTQPLPADAELPAKWEHLVDAGRQQQQHLTESGMPGNQSHAWQAADSHSWC